MQRLQEAYPDLKSNANFLALQDQLEGTENRINASRRDYNGAVQEYNTTVRTFPTAIGATGGTIISQKLREETSSLNDRLAEAHSERVAVS